MPKKISRISDDMWDEIDYRESCINFIFYATRSETCQLNYSNQTNKSLPYRSLQFAIKEFFAEIDAALQGKLRSAIKRHTNPAAKFSKTERLVICLVALLKTSVVMLIAKQSRLANAGSQSGEDLSARIDRYFDLNRSGSFIKYPYILELIQQKLLDLLREQHDLFISEKIGSEVFNYLCALANSKQQLITQYHYLYPEYILSREENQKTNMGGWCHYEKSHLFLVATQLNNFANERVNKLPTDGLIKLKKPKLLNTLDDEPSVPTQPLILAAPDRTFSSSSCNSHSFSYDSRFFSEELKQQLALLSRYIDRRSPSFVKKEDDPEFKKLAKKTGKLYHKMHTDMRFGFTVLLFIALLQRVVVWVKADVAFESERVKGVKLPIINATLQNEMLELLRPFVKTIKWELQATQLWRYVLNMAKQYDEVCKMFSHYLVLKVCSKQYKSVATALHFVIYDQLLQFDSQFNDGWQPEVKLTQQGNRSLAQNRFSLSANLAKASDDTFSKEPVFDINSVIYK